MRDRDPIACQDGFGFPFYFHRDGGKTHFQTVPVALVLVLLGLRPGTEHGELHRLAHFFSDVLLKLLKNGLHVIDFPGRPVIQKFLQAFGALDHSGFKGLQK